MNYIRWKEDHIDGENFDSLKRGHVYRDKEGNLFVYVGYCDIDLSEDLGSAAFKGKAEALIALNVDFDSPVVPTVIATMKTAIDKGFSNVYTVLSDDPRDGGRTLILKEHNSKHNLFHEMTEFIIPDETLWKIKGLHCNYTDYCNMGMDYKNLVIKYEHIQDTCTYSAVLLNPQYKVLKLDNSIFFDVSITGETFNDFHNRMLRKINLFLSLHMSKPSN